MNLFSRTQVNDEVSTDENGTSILSRSQSLCLPSSPSPFSRLGRRGAKSFKVPLTAWERDLG
jgi:hypothetical protein